MTDSPKEKKFMREKVVKPPINKRQIAGRFVCLLLLAVIFGVVAAISFVVSRPMAEKFLGKEPETTPIPITIERDTEPPTTTAKAESLEESVSLESQSQAVKEEIEQIVRKEIDEFLWTSDNVEAVNQILRDAAQAADKSIVTVSSVKRQVDWFDNPVETTGRYAGMILAVNSNEVLILTGKSAVEGADSLEVTFGDGSMAAGTIKQQDSANKMVVLSVAATELSETALEWIEAVELGNSYSVKTGDIILAVGSPSGPVHSVKRGLVSYVAKGVQTADGQTRVLYMDFECSREKGTFFLNMAGQLLGWATDLYDTEEAQGITMAMPVSEYKGSLQKLMNGIPIPYMGIYAQDVSEAMQEQGIPQGIYITESIAEGPAYLAGIQNGDILTGIQEDTIASIRDFQSCLENLETGVPVTVKVQRKGIDEYKEIEYNVTIGAR